MKIGRAVRRVGRDSEFANSADLSTRILRFGNLEVGGLSELHQIHYNTNKTYNKDVASYQTVLKHIYLESL